MPLGAMSIVTRFAPSPTGYLHLGHAASAVNAWRRARSAGGRFLLRLEDIDASRCRPDYAAAIQEDLTWLGLDWDGPVRVQSEHLGDYQAVLDELAGHGLVYPCFCTRADIMREVAASTAAPHAPDGSVLYPGTCRNLSAGERTERVAAGERFALRLDMREAVRRITPNVCGEPNMRSGTKTRGGANMWTGCDLWPGVSLRTGGKFRTGPNLPPEPSSRTSPGLRPEQLPQPASRPLPGPRRLTGPRPQAETVLNAGHCLQYHEEFEGWVTCRPERFGDVILARKDAPASYHLCVTHDDALQGVNLVTRGIDLKPATDLHRLIQALLGWPAPAYAHHPLLRDAQGRRLAKRDQAATLRSMRAAGTTAERILGGL